MRKPAYLLLVCSIFLSGCAAQASRMVPTDFKIVKKHPVTVSVGESVGGRETNPLWTSQVSNSAFTEALENALVKSRVFQAVNSGGEADYLLDVTILSYDVPFQPNWDSQSIETFDDFDFRLSYCF